MLTIKHYNMKRTAGKWLALIGLAAITSCNYLDVVPPATPDFEDTMKDRDATLGFLYSCYAGIPVMYGNWSCRFFGASDEAVLPQIYGYDSQFIQYNQVTTTTNHAAGPWVNAYNTIGQINIFLKYIDVLHPTNVSPEDKARWKAECKFLHAYYHHELLRAYGPIPLVTKYIPNSTPKAEFPGRSPYDVCVDSIAKWYDEAAEILPATLPSDELGRATSTACKALKARLLLYAASPLWNGSFPYPDWKNDKFSVPGQGKKLVSNTYDATKWQRALDACTEAIDFAETRGQRKLFDVATSETLRRNDGLDLPSYPGLDSIARKHIMQMRYLMCSTEDEGNRETIFGVIIGDKNPVSISVPHGITLNGSGSPIGGWEGLSPTWYTMTHFYTQNGKLPAQDPGYFPQADWLKSAGQANPNVVKLMAYREPRFCMAVVRRRYLQPVYCKRPATDGQYAQFRQACAGLQPLTLPARQQRYGLPGAQICAAQYQIPSGRRRKYKDGALSYHPSGRALFRQSRMLCGPGPYRRRAGRPQCSARTGRHSGVARNRYNPRQHAYRYDQERAFHRVVARMPAWFRPPQVDDCTRLFKCKLVLRTECYRKNRPVVQRIQSVEAH